MNAHWEKIDSFYLGNGWYGDGSAAQRDYYIAWAFHFYSLLWTYIDSMMPDTIRETIFKRAEEFASGFKWFFGDDGEAVPFGRSLIYRFAQVAFWSVYKLNELHGQPNGLVKGLISRNLNWWFDKEILKPDGTLNIGYAYQNHFITETYNAEGSPYWAFKVFVLLLIPNESDFWDAALEQYEESDMETYLKGGDFYISRNKGITTIYPYGLSDKHPWPSATGKYHKFAYTTGFGFCVARGMERMEYIGMDSTLALAINGSHWVVRHGASEWQRVADNVFVSSWNEGLETCIKTYLCVMGPWHVRVHRIHTESPIEAADGGYSVPDPLTKFVDDKRRVYTSNASKHLFAAAVSMDRTGKAAECKPPENSNLMHPRVKVPYIFRAFEPGMHLWLNAFYGGAEEPCEIPVVSVEKNKVVMTLGNRKAECIIDETQVSSSDQVLSPPAESVAQKVLSFFLRPQ